MREDFKKLLVESPRVGSHKNYGEIRHRKGVLDHTGEFVERRKSMSQWYKTKGVEKDFGEHLSPLYRFLMSSVGRKWDDIYSEIKAQNPGNSAVGNHIMQHLWGSVTRAEEIQYIDGAPYNKTMFRGQMKPSKVTDLYVDQDGVLRYIPRKTSKSTTKSDLQEKINKVFRKVSDQLELIKDKGVWFEYVRKQKPEPRLVYDRPFEILFTDWMKMSKEERRKNGVLVKRTPAVNEFSDPIYELRTQIAYLERKEKRYNKKKKRSSLVGAKVPGTYLASRRQLSTDELKKHGLKNDAPKEQPRSENQKFVDHQRKALSKN